MNTSSESASNDYLDQVVRQQAQVEQELRQEAAESPAALAALRPRARAMAVFSKKGREEEEAPRGPALPAPALNYRITGFWRWQTVVVPPNMYVVHTRRDHAEPLHLGLGISFPYDPYLDAFLVIPAAVQTLLINARCICAERQGVLVQAYVQWVVEDVRTAYRKLDFSDRRDPMRIVNVQLREQAEAAIKDKVATMPIDAILNDKQPIIEELTQRLRSVAEGTREDASSGLGLKIVTVQIKEAVVSSTHLWENLQKPFRAERERLARMAELDAAQQIARQELANRQARETAELEHARLMERLRAEQERETYERQQAEAARRLELEQAAEQQAIAQRTATDKTRREAELELALKQLELNNRRLTEEIAALRRQVELERARAELEAVKVGAALEVENTTHEARARREERDLGLLKVRRAVENDVTEPLLRARLIEQLPQIARSLPKPDELRAVSINGDQASGPLVGFLASVLQVAQGALTPAGNGHKAEG
jgi:hypothetical protein